MYAKDQQARDGNVSNVVLFAIEHISFSEKRKLCFHGSLLLRHPCSFLSFYQRAWSQQMAKQTQALKNTVSLLDETAGPHMGNLCSLTGWCGSRCMSAYVCVCGGGKGTRVASLKSFLICSPDCNGGLCLLSLYYKI